MSKKGFTLIETIGVLCIFTILSFSAFKISAFIFNIYNNTSINVYDKTNARIAEDFIFDIIKNSKIVSCEDEVYVDSKRIYVKDNILRYNTDSEQIADGICSFVVKDVGEGLYYIKINENRFSCETYVKRRNIK